MGGEALGMAQPYPLRQRLKMGSKAAVTHHCSVEIEADVLADTVEIHRSRKFAMLIVETTEPVGAQFCHPRRKADRALHTSLGPCA